MASLFEEILEEGTAPLPPPLTITVPDTGEMDNGVPDDLSTIPDWVGASTDRVTDVWITGVAEMLFANYDFGRELLLSRQCSLKDIVGDKLADDTIRYCLSVEFKNEQPHFHLYIKTKSKHMLSAYIRAMKKNGLGINECRPQAKQKKCLLALKVPKNAKSKVYRKDVCNLANYCSLPSSDKKGEILNQSYGGDFFGYDTLEAFVTNEYKPPGSEPPKKKRKTKAVPTCASEFDLSQKKGCIALVNWWMDANAKFYTTHDDVLTGIIEDDPDGEIFLMVMDRSDQIKDWITTYLHLRYRETPIQCLGMGVWFGASDCGKTYNVDVNARRLASLFLDDNWHDENIPISNLLYRFNLTDSSKTGHTREPFLAIDELDGSTACHSIMKQMTDTCPADKRSFQLPVKYSKQQHKFNHLAMLATSNEWITDLYPNKFGEDDAHWQAIVRRCFQLQFYPRYRINVTEGAELDPTDLELDNEGKPIRNRCEMDGTTLLRDSQSFDITSKLQAMTWSEALHYKVSWMDQLGDMLPHDKSRHMFQDTTNHRMEHDLEWDCGRGGSRKIWTR